MGDVTIPPEILRMIADGDRRRAETANDALRALTDRERRILREAAVMGWVRGSMHAGGGPEHIRGGREMVLEVITCCTDMPDLYPTLTAAARGELDPDWADVRESARKAGMKPEVWTPGEVHWGRRDSRGIVDPDSGWASVRRRGARVVVDMVGPGPYPKRTASLVDPTPAEVMAAVRLVGLDGGTGGD